MKNRKHVCLALLSLTIGWATLQAAITVVNPTGADHIPKSDCPSKDGSNKLNPDPPTYLPPPAATADIFTELKSGDSSFTGWTFQTGTALNGTLTINYYQSKFLSAHRSGADIKATYTRATNDPATLRWVQLVETSDPKTGATSPYIDPYPSDDPTNTTALPFYWTEKETKQYGDVFSDFSKRSHPPTSTVTWRGHLYLSSWDGKNPGTVTLHDGIQWGFDAGCAISNTTVTPRLTKTGGDKADLDWATNSGLWPSHPERNSDLTDPSGWTPLTNQPTLSDGHYHLEVETLLPREFFRIALTIPNPPLLLQPADFRVQPLSGVVTQGWELYLSVKADGDDPISYQWYHNGEPILGETSRELSIPHAQFFHEGNYSVSVTNEAGGAVSTEALITVVPDTNAPTLVSAMSSNLTQILVTFSEPIDPVSAQYPPSYQVQRLNPPGTVQVINATLGDDPSTVLLMLHPSSPLQPATKYQLVVVSGACDFATPPNCVAPGSSTMFNTPEPPAQP